MIDNISAYKSHIAFMGLDFEVDFEVEDFEVDKPRMDAEC